MLIDFYVGHFLTFDEIQRFSMRSAKESKGTANCIDGKGILRTSFIYGPNAAGKSNFAKAFVFSKGMITKGYVDYDENMPSIYLHIKKDGTTSTSDAYFEYLIEINGTLYQYGIEVGENQYITSEWLFKSVDNRHETIFAIQRPYGEKSKQQISNRLKTQFDKYLDVLESDRLSFLHFNIDSNDDCRILYTWFYSYLIINSFEYHNVSMIVGEEFLPKFSEELKNFDTNITGIDTDWDDIEDDAFSIKYTHANNLDYFARETKIISVLEEIPGSMVLTFHNGHLFLDKNENGRLIAETVYFNHKHDLVSRGIYNESTGTQRIIGLSLVINGIRELPQYSTGVDVPAINCEKTVIVDEIECSLHPILVMNLINKFLMNKNHSQLIVTTHEMSFLEMEPFFKDAYWFIDRKHDKTDDYTELYSLLEFTDVNKKLYCHTYESGRIGAVPHISIIEREVE